MQKLAVDIELFFKVLTYRLNPSHLRSIVTRKNEYAVSLDSFMKMVIGTFSGNITVKPFLNGLPDDICCTACN